MKKNILLVQSFIILPLLSSSLLLSMDQKPTYATVTQGTQLPQPLKKSGSKKRNRKKSGPAQQQQTAASAVTENAVLQPNPLNDYLSEEDKIKAEKDLETAKNHVNYTPGVYDMLMAIQALSMGHGLNPISTVTSSEVQQPSVNLDSVKIQVSEILEESILSPSERRELGLSAKLWNALRSNRSVTIELLNNKTFETDNAVHTEYFNQAIEECAQYQDLNSLTAIMNACQADEYKQGMQSAINHVAPVFNFLCEQYQAQVNHSNSALIDCNEQCAQQLNEESARLKANLVQLLNQHRDRVHTIGTSFEEKAEQERKKVETLNNLIHNVSALNKKVIPHENKLRFELQLNVPVNSVANIEKETQQRVRHLLTHANMPQAKTNILALGNK